MSRLPLPEPHEAGPPPEVGPGRCRALVPDWLRWDLPFLTTGGEVGLVEILILSKFRWAGRPEASDPAWLTVPFGPFVVAVRVQI